jgi:hypothetical protein
MVGVLWMVFPRPFKHMHCILHTMPFFKVKLVESKIVSAAHICRSHFLGGGGGAYYTSIIIYILRQPC